MADLLGITRELHSIAQAGLSYPSTPYDVARYQRLREIAADLMAELTGGSVQVRTDVLADIGYLTPKIDLRAAVLDGDRRLLMVQEATDGGWTLPGGWADVGESLGEGVVREVREEAGLAVRVVRQLGLYERERRGHPPLPWFTVKLVVACEPTGDTEVRADGVETLDAAWFSAAQASTLKLSPTRTSPWLLERVQHLLDHPDAPVDLD